VCSERSGKQLVCERSVCRFLLGSSVHRGGSPVRNIYEGLLLQSVRRFSFSLFSGCWQHCAFAEKGLWVARAGHNVVKRRLAASSLGLPPAARLAERGLPFSSCRSTTRRLRKPVPKTVELCSVEPLTLIGFSGAVSFLRAEKRERT
jgi:hypothetical protein